MNDETLTHLAQMLHAMQQVVLLDAQQTGGNPDPNRIFGAAIAGHWLAVRKGLGLAGKWATLDETKAALRASPGAVASGDAFSGALDFDMGAWDGVAGMCTTCGYDGARGPQGECTHCGARG